MKKLSTLLLLFALLGCSPLTNLHVEQTYDPGTDISKLKTFTWVDRESKGVRDPHYQQTLKDSVLAVLIEKGYVQASHQADFIVAAYINLEKKNYTIEDTSNLKRTVRSSDGQPIHVKIEEGGIFVSFLEKATQTNFFRGMAKSQLDRTLSPKKIDQQIQMATKEILKDFPESK